MGHKPHKHTNGDLSSKGKPIHYETCDGKNKYSKNQAESMKTTLGRSRGKDLRIYECPKCFGYHLTKDKSNFDNYVD